MAIFPGSAIPSAVSDYEIDNSLRLDDGDSAYLSRTMSTPTNNKKWTLSTWFKRGNITQGQLLSAGGNQIFFVGTTRFSFAGGASGTVERMKTTQLFRDPSAWYHIVFSMDTTQSAFSDQMKLYVNGTQVTAFDTSTAITQNDNTQINSAIAHRVGGYSGGGEHWDGYLAEYYFVDGSVLDADDFGELDSDTNQWKPIDASGLTFGTNGFYQKYAATELAASFTDSSKMEKTFTPTETLSVDVLLVGGGGGGQSGFGGGGGAGGIWNGTSHSVTAQDYSVVVGTGGQGGSAAGSSSAAGGNTTFDSKIGYGGGGTSSDRSGGSGQGAGEFGGAGTSTQTDQGGTGYGNAGGTMYSSGSSDNPGGGGGAGAVGGNGSSAKAGDGGAGQAFTITGASVTYGGGGGGGSRISADDEGAGGAGGGGNGAGDASETAGNGTDGLGGGGGGGGQDAGAGPQPASAGGNGGSGIAIIRYASTTAKASGGTITSYADGGTTYQVHSFTYAHDAHTITANGDVTNTRAVRKIGDSSIKFDGNGDYLSVPDSSDWDIGTGDFTMECWCNASNLETTTQVYLWDIRESGGNRLTCASNAAGTNGIWPGTGWGNLTGWAFPASTWFHVAVVRQSGTGRIYLDGVQKDTLGSWTTDFDGSWTFHIGDRYDNAADSEINGYLDEIRFSNTCRYDDGTTFTPSTTAFTADANTKLLIHSNWDGGLGADSSGNYNTFTATNLVATDQMPDTPTRNWCTLNPLDYQGTITASEGNLKAVTNASDPTMKATIALPSTGKWYWEFLMQYSTSMMIGVVDQASTGAAYTSNKAVLYSSGLGTKYNFSSVASYGATWTTGDLMGVAFNRDDNEITFYKNNSAQPTLTIGGTADQRSRLIPLIVTGTGGTDGGGTFNFGQDSSFAGAKTAQGNKDSNDQDEVDFYYQPPSGYLALLADNLSDPEIALPGEYFNTVLYTGNDTARSITGVGFDPDFLWVKERSSTSNNMLFDALRGSGTNRYRLNSNTTVAEITTDPNVTLITDGFTVSSSDGGMNADTDTYVAWNWKAGGAPTADNSAGAGATPTAGSVKIDGSNLGSALAGTIPAIRLSANTTSGFSIVSYTGTGSAATVAHGLSQTPEFFTVKSMDVGGRGWTTWAESLTETQALDLNDSVAAYTSTTSWNSAFPTSSVLNLGTRVGTNESATTYIGYCFHSVEGYSKVGSYTGNGVSDGTFVYLGFQPAYCIFKAIDEVNGWFIWDSTTNPENVMTKYLTANVSDAEGTYTGVDFLSNGLKFRSSGGGDGFNKNTINYIYLAFAESPFKTSNAR